MRSLRLAPNASLKGRGCSKPTAGTAKLCVLEQGASPLCTTERMGSDSTQGPSTCLKPTSTILHVAKKSISQFHMVQGYHEKTRRNCKPMSLSERSRSEKAPCCMIPSIRDSGKSTTMERVKRSVVARGWGGVRDDQRRAQRVVETLHTIRP